MNLLKNEVGKEYSILTLHDRSCSQFACNKVIIEKSSPQKYSHRKKFNYDLHSTIIFFIQILIPRNLSLQKFSIETFTEKNRISCAHLLCTLWSSHSCNFSNFKCFFADELLGDINITAFKKIAVFLEMKIKLSMNLCFWQSISLEC